VEVAYPKRSLTTTSVLSLQSRPLLCSLRQGLWYLPGNCLLGQINTAFKHAKDAETKVGAELWLCC